MTAASQVLLADPLDGYLLDKEIARIRKIEMRTLRAERQRGEGPPYVKDGRRIYYSVDGFRQWLKSRERQPVRAR